MLCRHVLLGQPKSRKLIQGQIKAALPPVLTNVAQDVGQLEGYSHLHCVRSGSGLETNDAHTHQAYRRSNTITIYCQLFKRGIAGLVQISLYSIQQLIGKPNRNVMASAWSI